MNKIIIAIDGYSSSGKSTMARDLAKRIGYVYVDSGAMYRAVTLYAIEHGMASADKGVDTEALVKALPEINISFTPAGADGVQHTLLNGKDVEREIRDMQVSSLVSPVAVIPEVRHRLTALQQQYGREKGTDKGEKVTYEEVLENIRERDHIDTTRKESPLRKAPDAVLLDNDNMTIAQQMQWLLDLYHSKCPE